MTKLYELTKGDRFMIPGSVILRDYGQDEAEPIFIFDHIDGMYSFCENEDGELFHPAAFTEVIPLPKEE